MYATSVVGDRLVVVVLALMQDADYETAISAITEVGQSIKPQDTYIDPEKIQESLLKE